MLYILDPSLIESIRSSDRKETTIRAIERIVYSQIFGNHIFFSDRETLKALIDEDLFQDIIQSQLRRLYNRLPQLGLFQSFRTRLEIVNGERIHDLLTTQNDFVIRISPDVLLSTHITERPIFLGENVRDIETFRKIGDVYLCANHISNLVRIDFESVGGGGNTIGDQYEKIQCEEQKLCLSIADTDWEYKDDSIGETARKLKTIHQKNIIAPDGHKRVFSHVTLLFAREIENLVPTSILFDTFHDNQQKQKFLNWLTTLEEVNPETRFFIDFKNGFKLKGVIESENQEMIHYWLSAIQFLLPHCTYEKEEDCEDDCVCIESPGLGDKILPKTLEQLNRTSAQKLLEAINRNPLLKEQWLEIGEQIVLWFCCFKNSYAL